MPTGRQAGIQRANRLDLPAGRLDSRSGSGMTHNRKMKRSGIAEKKDRLKAFLKESGFKSTRQRDVIANAFLRSEEHVTAEELYRKINRRHKDIGFTTVYRTLKLLTKSGLATERVFADNLTRYEPLSSEDHHDHLICLNCGSITEFENTKLEKLQDRIAEDFGFHPITHKMEFYGYCRDCKEQISEHRRLDTV